MKKIQKRIYHKNLISSQFLINKLKINNKKIKTIYQRNQIKRKN